MRAKLKIQFVRLAQGQETLYFTAVCRDTAYPADGTDENNTFAKWTPTAELNMTVTNPSLFGQFKPGQEFYVDFTPVAEPAQDPPGPPEPPREPSLKVA